MIDNNLHIDETSLVLEWVRLLLLLLSDGSM